MTGPSKAPLCADSREFGGYRHAGMSEAQDITIYRYSRRALTGDYLRSAGGVGLGGFALTAADPGLWLLAIFGGLTAIFGFFGLKTAERQLLQVALTPEGIFTRSLLRKEIPWSELRALKLRFYGTRRQVKSGSGGFMQMTLDGRRDRMRFESSVDGFSDIAWHAARAMRQNSLTVDPTTAGNLLALGVNADEDTPRPVNRPPQGE